VRVRRLKKRGQDVPAVNLLLPGALGLQQSVFDDALEGRRIFGQKVARSRNPLHLLAEESLQLAHQRFDAPAALPHDVRRRLLVQQRVQKMFERHVFVAALDGLGRREIQCFL
jgi:hypothetical protein